MASNIVKPDGCNINLLLATVVMVKKVKVIKISKIKRWFDIKLVWFDIELNWYITLTTVWCGTQQHWYDMTLLECNIKLYRFHLYDIKLRSVSNCISVISNTICVENEC